MAINTCAANISAFKESVSNYSDRVFYTPDAIKEISEVVEKKCENLKSYLDNVFNKIQYHISMANHAITKNKLRVSSLKDSRYDLEQKMHNAPEGADMSDVKKAISQYNNAIANVNGAIAKLYNLISRLQNQEENVRKNLSRLDEYISQASSVASSAVSTVYSYTSYLHDVTKDSDSAYMYTKKIDECLSSIAGTSVDDNKFITIRSGTSLINMGNALNSSYQTFGDANSDYARLLNSFLNIIQDEVTRGVASKSEAMLNNFAYQTKDFPNNATNFKKAAEALHNYERIKR